MPEACAQKEKARLSSITATPPRIRASATMTGYAAGIEPRARTGRGRAVTASPSPPQRAQDDRHTSVEQLSVPVITAIASARLVNRDTLADIKPSFENDTNIVPMPPEEAAFSNCEKVVERDVEVYRKKA
jgi:hypothetical protein